MHRVDSELARRTVNTHHMTRENFVDLYEAVFGFAPPKEAASALKAAEGTRDAVLHGKQSSDRKIRTGIGRVLEYAAAINNQLYEKNRLKPFGKLQGQARL